LDEGDLGAAMKSDKWMAVLAAALLLAGCKGFWNLPAGSSNGGGSGSGSSGVFYVANQATNEVAGFSIVGGKLSDVSGSPYTLSVQPRSLAVAPNGSFLYVGTLAGGTFLYSVGSGGALTIGNSGQAVSFDLASAMKVDPSGSWLLDAFATLSGGVQVNAIPITSTGTVDLARSEQSPAFNVTGASVNGLAISPDGNYVFVAAGTAGTLVVPFAHGSSSPLGASNAVTIQPLHANGSALSVAVDPTNRLFYIGETLGNSSANSGGLRVFNYSSLGSATLTQASGSPLASGDLAPAAILPLASGDYVYVTSGHGTSTGIVQGFAITTGGTATAPTYTIASAGNSVSAGTQPAGLAEDNSGTYVLAINSGGNPDLNAFTVSTGTLTSAVTSQTGTDPTQASAIVALPQ